MEPSVDENELREIFFGEALEGGTFKELRCTNVGSGGCPLCFRLTTSTASFKILGKSLDTAQEEGFVLLRIAPSEEKNRSEVVMSKDVCLVETFKELSKLKIFQMSNIEILSREVAMARHCTK